MARLRFTNALIVNEGRVFEGELLVEDGRITQIGTTVNSKDVATVDVAGRILMPGIIDDQVHFREPGLTHKAEIATESLAAAAGGVTSFMDMPNVKPASLTQELLEERYRMAAERSAVNFSFYMGASNDNLAEVLKTDPTTVCGIKAFMGSSTGNMLVDDPLTLRGLFAQAPTLVATHCEDEETVREATARVLAAKGKDATASDHPDVRPREGCYRSSSFAVALAKEYHTRLHVLHITTAEEVALFEPGPVSGKRITAEACVHHLRFSRDDYAALGNGLKCNPAVKDVADREAIWAGLLADRIDVIATDHAPHTIEEKAQHYWQAPGGVPLVQHSLLMMDDARGAGRFDWPQLVRKMCHAVADCFDLVGRGYLREGYAADLVIFDPHTPTVVDKTKLYSKCGWSPFAGHTFPGSVAATYVNGRLVYDGSTARFVAGAGQRLRFAS